MKVFGKPIRTLMVCCVANRSEKPDLPHGSYSYVLGFNRREKVCEVKKNKAAGKK